MRTQINKVLFLLAVLAAIITIIFTFVHSAQAEESGPLSGLRKDGRVRFFVFHTGESAEIRYLDGNGEWIAGTDEKIRRLLRSRGDGKDHPIDRRLIALADHVQDHFGADTVEVISGYRSPDFNAHLKETGHQVARESFHMKGMAMDIHLDEIRESAVRDYLRSLGLGGVGYYGDRLMVHMDFGPKRAWDAGAFRQNTEIGIFNKGNLTVLRSDKLFYDLGETLTLKSSSFVPEKLLLQKFHRGEWVTSKEMSDSASGGGSSQKRIVLDETFLKPDRDFPSIYGKYRFRWEQGNEWQHSNEFYVKRK